jgi:hypothetical protein
MRIALKHLGLITVGLVFVSTLVAQDKDKKDASTQKDQKEKLITVGELAGKITNIDQMEKSLHLQVNNKQNVKVMTVDEVKIRTKNPPVAYDDKGNKKKYTQKELQELRGSDRKLPGYTAGFEDLKTNQYVQVTLVRRKSDKNPKDLTASVILIAKPAK